jgi:hypothetical protein
MLRARASFDRRLAKYHIRRESDGHALHTTVVIHEAYLRLIDANQALLVFLSRIFQERLFRRTLFPLTA